METENLLNIFADSIYSMQQRRAFLLIMIIKEKQAILIFRIKTFVLLKIVNIIL